MHEICRQLCWDMSSLSAGFCYGYQPSGEYQLRINAVKAGVEVRITNHFGGQSIEDETRRLFMSNKKKLNSLYARWRRRKRGMAGRK
jgi:hypothetical protein